MIEKKRTKLEAHVLVKCFQGLTDDCNIFFKLEESKKEFEEYTGVSYDLVYGEDGDYESHMPEDFDQTKIFTVELELPLDK